MSNLFIQNRKELNIAVSINESENQRSLVFLMHGFLGFKEQPLLLEVGKIFKENNFTTVSFDTTNSLGESDGKMEDGTMTGYFEDLEDVISWAKSQKFYFEPFFLVGHSLGGYCVANYAVKNKNVKSLILLCPVVSGELFQQTNDIKEILEEWKETGMRTWNSRSNPGGN
ncbi:MAG: alpha/beta fold hydrolase [Minisyncoccales bacterium]